MDCPVQLCNSPCPSPLPVRLTPLCRRCCFCLEEMREFLILSASRGRGGRGQAQQSGLVVGQGYRQAGKGGLVLGDWLVPNWPHFHFLSGNLRVFPKLFLCLSPPSHPPLLRDPSPLYPTLCSLLKHSQVCLLFLNNDRRRHLPPPPAPSPPAPAPPLLPPAPPSPPPRLPLGTLF